MADTVNWDNWLSFNWDDVLAEIAALNNVVTQTVVASPSVVNSPTNTAPVVKEVQQTVQQVVTAIAPIIAPNVPPVIITKTVVPAIVTTVVQNPEIKATPSGTTVSAATTASITTAAASNISQAIQSPNPGWSAPAFVQEQITSNTIVPVDEVTKKAAADAAKAAAASVGIPTEAGAGTTTDSQNAARIAAEAFNKPRTDLDSIQAAYDAAVKNQESSTIINGLKAKLDEAKKVYALSPVGIRETLDGKAPASVVTPPSGTGGGDGTGGTVPPLPPPPGGTPPPTGGTAPIEPPAGFPGTGATDNTEETADEYVYDAKTGILSLNGKPFTGTWTGQIFKDGVLQGFAGSTSTTTVTATGSTATPVVTATGSTATPVVTATGTTAATEQQRQSIITILTDRFNKYGLGSLAAKIKDLAIDGASEATITIGLQDTEEYKTRFSANEDRMKKGLKVLTPGEYLNVEDGYRQVLRAYGLKQFDTDAYVKQFISNDVSASELSDRVVTAVQRVQNADPAISKTLRDYYGIANADMVAYVLDPNQQLQKIQRQVAAAEIGTAARRQGLEAGVTVSEQLAAQGISEAEAQKGYATIADILPTAEKLSSIYGGTMQKYGQAEGEQEVFNNLASAQRAREKLSAREIAQFQGSSGTMKTSLSSQTKGLI